MASWLDVANLVFGRKSGTSDTFEPVDKTDDGRHALKVDTLRDNPAATLLNLLPNSTDEKTLRLEKHGANQQFDYHLRGASGAALDTAVFDAMRFRRVGPKDTLACTYSRSGTTVTVTTVGGLAHNLETGDVVFHTGATDPALDQELKKVTVTGTTTYTYTTAAAGAASGSITLRAGPLETKYRSGIAVTDVGSGW